MRGKGKAVTFPFFMLEEVEAVLSNPKRNKIALTYKKVFGKDLNVKCGSCYSDAIIELTLWARNTRYLNSDIYLFISKYTAKDAQRQAELDLCYQINKDNPLIKDIIGIEGRTYNEFFEAMQPYKESVNIIANADIFFNETIGKARQIRPFECYALTRWNYKDGHADFFNRRDSQDVWIFRGAPRGITGDFNLGVPGCDNHLAWNIKQAKYVITNPSLSIHAIHVQEKESVHRDEDRLPEPYLLLTPTLLT